jgi:hypothetical protein
MPRRRARRSIEGGSDTIKWVTVSAALIAAAISLLNYLDAQGWFPPAKKLPDLVVAPSPQGDFCQLDEANNLILTVENLGAGDAAESTRLQVQIGSEDDDSPHVLALETPEIQSGEIVTLDGIPIPTEWQTTGFLLHVYADATQSLVEENDSNNQTTATCFTGQIES